MPHQSMHYPIIWHCLGTTRPGGRQWHTRIYTDIIVKGKATPPTRFTQNKILPFPTYSSKLSHIQCASCQVHSGHCLRRQVVFRRQHACWYSWTTQRPAVHSQQFDVWLKKIIFTSINIPQNIPRAKHWTCFTSINIPQNIPKTKHQIFLLCQYPIEHSQDQTPNIFYSVNIL